MPTVEIMQHRKTSDRNRRYYSLIRDDGAWNKYTVDYDYYIVMMNTGHIICGPVKSTELIEKHKSLLDEILEVQILHDKSSVFYII